MHHKVFGEGADKAGIITLEENNPEDWPLQHIWIPVSDTVHINNGQPDVSADTLNAIGSLSYILPLVSNIGDHTAKLYVTFTPDAVTEGTFANTTTAEPVTAKTKDGYLICEHRPIHTDIDIEPLD